MTPRSRCENDAGYETRLLEAPDPKRGPHFFCSTARSPRTAIPLTRAKKAADSGSSSNGGVPQIALDKMLNSRQSGSLYTRARLLVTSETKCEVKAKLETS